MKTIIFHDDDSTIIIYEKMVIKTNVKFHIGIQKNIIGLITQYIIYTFKRLFD
jgi:hypothetical protein